MCEISSGRPRKSVGHDLAGVGIAAHLGILALAEEQHPHGLVAPVRNLVRALDPGRERDHLAGLQLAPPFGCAQAGPARDHDQHLLLGRVPVVRADRLPGIELIEARAEVRAAGLPPEPGAAVREPRLLLVSSKAGWKRFGPVIAASPGGSSPSQ